jgi:TonB-dependent receptor
MGMRLVTRTLALLASAIVVLAFVSPCLAQQSAGSVSGVVSDASTGSPLVGANVVLDGASFVASTDRSGRFLLSGVPAGRYDLLAIYLGHKTERSTITVIAASRLQVDVALAPESYHESVTVTADPIEAGQARALNQQRTAPTIVNVISSDQIGAFPDPNAAEASSRIPGVSIARDQGEGRYILIRGTEPRLNSVMIDGERIPAPEGDVRQVQLDAVPADQLQSIEVSKAVTPDMDADSIGGAVNLVTKQAVRKPTLLFSAAGGYNALQDSRDERQFTLTAGRRFFGGRTGLLAGFSSSRLERGSENFEAVYAAGYLDDLQLRDYQIERSRNGVNLSADVALANSGTLTFKSIYNKFNDYEINNRIRFRPSASRIEHVLKNRNQSDTIVSFSGIGQHLLGQKTTLDYRLSWSRSEEEQPDRLDTTLRQSKITFTPNVSPTSIDPENIQPNPSANDASKATLNSWKTEIFDTWDRDVTGAFNVRRAFLSANGRTAFLKFGAKVKSKEKDRDFTATSATPVSTVPFASLQDEGFDNSRFLDFFPAGYAPFPGINPSTSRAMFESLPSSKVTPNHEGDAQNYNAKERVVAAYAQAEYYAGDRLLILPGLRYESTNVDYSGFDVTYDDGGNYASTVPVSGSNTTGRFLPGLHVKYAMTPSANVRAALTRTLARPNYYDLVPYQLVHQENGEIERGNPNLKATTSNNADLLFERYFTSVGVISGGVFYKHLSDYIYPFIVGEQVYGETYRVTQPRNGDSGWLWGMEFAFQNQFRHLPSPLDGLGVMGNYTWTDSSATFPDRSAASSLPGQSKHLGNLSVWYEKFGFSGRVSWNFHGKYIDAVGDTADTDVYYDNHKQIDVNLSQTIVKGIRVYADFLNLTNAPLRYYQGSSNRPIQQEYYRWWAMFGVKASF